MTAANATVSPGESVALDGETRTRATIVNCTGVANVPRGVVIMTGPVAAPSGTSAITAEGPASTILAPAPLNDTEVTPALNPVPTNVTRSPAPPSCGKNPNKASASAASRLTAVKFPALS